MALTSNSDLFAAVNEAGINRVLRHVMRQRPSLFNYGSAGVARQPRLLCRPIDPHPVALARGDTLVSVEPALPIVGTDGSHALDFCLQFTLGVVDFRPGGTVALPPQLNPPLGPQRFALHGALCAGLACLPRDAVERIPPVFFERRLVVPPELGLRPGRPTVFPTGQLECFCLDLFVVGDVDFFDLAGSQHVRGRLDGLELVDLGPTGLENAVECYARLVLQLGLLPRLSVPVVRISKDLMGIATIAVQPTPTSAAVPNNPSLEADQVKVFLDIQTGPPGPPSPPSPPGPPGPTPTPGVVRARSRTGPFDVTAAVAERGVRELFGAVRDGFSFSKSGSHDFGAFSVSYAAAAHLQGGTIELRDDGTIRVRELDVKWDSLRACVGVNIPEICVGGFCILPNLSGGCLVRAPELCAFGADPDVSFCLDLGHLITSEVSATVRPVTKYAVNPARAPGTNDWEAKDLGVPSHWQVLIDPVTVDLDVFDIADTVGDLFERAVDAALDGALGTLPEWAKDLIRAILGPAVDAIRELLDLGDDFGEWLSDKIGVSLGLFNFLLTAVADYLAAGQPILQVEDPYPAMASEPGKMAVLIPIEYLGVRVTTDELVVEADVGA